MHIFALTQPIQVASVASIVVAANSTYSIIMADKQPTPAAATPVAAEAAPATTPAAAPTDASSSSASSTAVVPSSGSPSSDHQLETKWTFYFDRKLSREAQSAAGFTNYAQNLQKIGMFDSIEGFWSHYAFMQQPDNIPRDHNLYRQTQTNSTKHA